MFIHQEMTKVLLFLRNLIYNGLTSMHCYQPAPTSPNISGRAVEEAFWSHQYACVQSYHRAKHGQTSLICTWCCPDVQVWMAAAFTEQQKSMSCINSVHCLCLPKQCLISEKRFWRKLYSQPLDEIRICWHLTVKRVSRLPLQQSA